ncbi:MAG: hypothetical protein HKN68_11875 [Saprospiraceae bacterium]|nr:hypothetical protein [Saprospiraceae bacterium]
MGDKVEITLNANNNDKLKTQKTPHDRWKESFRRRKCKNYSEMAYWQNVSTCTQL